MPQNNDSPSRGSGSGLDTGTGGFPIDDKLYSYDVGVDDDGTGPRPSWSSGQVKVDNTKKDLSKGTMQTMASYLSKTTLGSTESSPTQAKNTYAVRHSENVDPTLFSLQDINGRPTGPSETSNIEKFIDGKKVTGKSDAATNLPKKLKGHTLLKDATPTVPAASAIGGKFTPSMSTSKPFVKDDKGNYPNESAAVIGNYYGDSRTLSNSVIYNRFNADDGNTYSEKGAGLTQFQFASKYSMGTSEADRNMSYGRLAQIGNALSIRAGLELTSTQENNNPTGNTATAAALLPGAAQLGVMRIERDTLTARSVLDDGLTDSIDTDLLIDPAAKSWGTLNNVLDHYAGISNFGMQLLSVALVAALGVAIAGFMLLFSLGGTSQFKMLEPDGRRVYGASTTSASDPGVGGITKILSGQLSIWQLLGIQPTFNNFENCLSVGALQFFGISPDSNNISAADLVGIVAEKGLISAAQNPGFYAVMARSFNRSFLLLTDYFVNLGAAFGSGFVAGITQIFSIIDVLRSSKFIKFLNIFGQLGDKNIGHSPSKSPYGSLKFEGTKGFTQKIFSDIDSAAPIAAGKGRVKLDGVSNLTQARSSFLAADLLMLPSIYTTAILDDPMHRTHNPSNKIAEAGIKDYDGRILTVSEGRIHPDTRRSMEEALESEYVPFYLHDVRTNEIISFHAFLTSLSDGYSVSYESTEAIGRVEPIKTYKNTTRKVGFSFILAAFSQADFEVMWMKINKLTTMLYPQFTEGRKLVDSKNSIAAPFSQSISAAPLVRVRIGDLIQSNYSKFALARLFGLYYSDSVLDTKTPNGPKPETTYEEAFKKTLQIGNTFTLAADVPVGEEAVEKQPESIVGSVVKKIVKIIPNLSLPGDAELKIKEIKKDDRFCLCTVVKKASATTNSSASPATAPTTTSVVTSNPKIKKSDKMKKQQPPVEPEAPVENPLFGRVIQVEISHLIPTPETQSKINNLIQQSRPTNPNSSYDDNVKKFMDENNGNAISRSFKTVGGKGLPGFIESLEFDWYDRVTWNTREDENDKSDRAPKMCKVTISFSPFHDITPGLDHVGYNRAPIYPVGPMAPVTRKG